MKSALILLVVSIIATPKESFAGLTKGLLVSTTAKIGLNAGDKTSMYAIKTDCVTNIDKVSKERFEWIDKQCEKHKCEWVVIKTHIATCKDSVLQLKNAIGTGEKHVIKSLEAIIKRFQEAVANIERNLPKGTKPKELECRKIMARIHAVLSEMLSNCKAESDKCGRRITALVAKQKTIL